MTVLLGDCRDILPTLDAGSVHCVVSSPPYWGLRDYGVAGQLGLEPTPEEYVANMVAVFREVRRVLRDDGTVWLNLGDSYANANPSGRRDADRRGEAGVFTDGDWHERQASGGGAYVKPLPPGLKPKDLVGIPWRVAFALQADGWYLRSEIIWSKPNPMPESVTDRPTKSHEQVFLLSKSPRYYYDSDAVRENVYDLRGASADSGVPREEEPSRRFVAMPFVFGEADAGLESTTGSRGEAAGGEPALAGISARPGGQGAAGWLATEAGRDGGLQAVGGRQGGVPTSTSVASGTSTASAVLPQETHVDGGSLHADGNGVGGYPGEPAGAVRVLWADGDADDGSRNPGQSGWDSHEGERGRGLPPVQRTQEGPAAGRNLRSVWNIATQPYPGAHFATFPEALVVPCIKAGCPEGGVVLDPFSGSGTVGRVAERLSRRSILIELNPEYVTLAEERTAQVGLGLTG